MADFSLSQIGEVAPSGPTPQGVPPVEPRGPSGAEVAANFAAQIGTSIFESVQAGQQKEQQSQINQAVARFSSQQVQIADAVDRGDLTSQEARMRMRANYSSAIADNPNLTEAFSEAHSSIISTAGLGKVAAEGTEQEQAFFKAQTSATENGWVTPNMTQDQAMEATYAYTQFQREQERLNAEQNVLSLKRAQIGIKKDKVALGTARINQENAALNLQQTRMQQSSRTAVGSMADAYTTRLRTKSETIMQQVEAGQLDPVEAVSILDDEWLAVQSTVAQAGREAGGEYISNVVSPMRDFYELTRRRITGEVNTEVYQSLSENALARQAANITGDPDVARVLATSQIVGQGGNLALQGPLTNIALNNVSRNGSETSRPADLTDPDNEEGNRQYLRLLKDGVSKVNNNGYIGNVDRATQEVSTNINQVLKGLGSYGSMVENPRQLNEVVNFLASDDYGKYVSSQGTAINAENADAARQVIQAQFEDQVRPLIQDEWRNAMTETSVLPMSQARGGIGGREEPTASLIKPFFTGTSVRFVPVDSSRSVPGLASKINNLNNKVSPVLNRLIKMGAHLQGTQDYQRIYESNYASLFGDVGTGEENE